MVSFKATTIAAAAALSVGVNAQFSGLGLSTSCTTAAVTLLFGDLGSCLSLTTLIPIFTATGSVIAPLDSYLGTICTSSACASGTLSSANTTIATDCATDLASGTGIVTALETIVEDYPIVREVACLEATANNTRCIIQTLYAVQNATGDSITVDYLTGLLGGNTTALTDLTSLDASVLCTDCTKAMYDIASQGNGTFTSGAIGKAISAKCGSDFTNGTFPADVTDPVATTTAAATGSASTSAAASSTAGAAMKGLESSPVAIWTAGALALGVLGGAVGLLL